MGLFNSRFTTKGTVYRPSYDVPEQARAGKMAITGNMWLYNTDDIMQSKA